MQTIQSHTKDRQTDTQRQRGRERPSLDILGKRESKNCHVIKHFGQNDNCADIEA